MAVPFDRYLMAVASDQRKYWYLGSLACNNRSIDNWYRRSDEAHEEIEFL
jgi:hypothetical protein